MAVLSEATLFENPDWVLSAEGLEHKETGYFIGRDLLGDRRNDGLWSWPAHMAEKTWVRPESFAQAFGAALSAYGIAPDAALAASFAAAGLERAERGRRPLSLPAGPGDIRLRPGAISTAPADEPDLPTWALPRQGPSRPLSPFPAAPR